MTNLKNVLWLKGNCGCMIFCDIIGDENSYPQGLIPPSNYKEKIDKNCKIHYKNNLKQKYE